MLSRTSGRTKHGCIARASDCSSVALLFAFEHRTFGSKTRSLHLIRFIDEIQLDGTPLDAIGPHFHGAVVWYAGPEVLDWPPDCIAFLNDCLFSNRRTEDFHNLCTSCADTEVTRTWRIGTSQCQEKGDTKRSANECSEVAHSVSLSNILPGAEASPSNNTTLHSAIVTFLR